MPDVTATFLSYTFITLLKLKWQIFIKSFVGVHGPSSIITSSQSLNRAEAARFIIISCVKASEVYLSQPRASLPNCPH